MIIINGGSSHSNSEGEKKLKEIKLHLYEVLNKLSCPNNCKNDMLIRLSYHERKQSVIANIYDPCCSDFEEEVEPFLT